MNLAVSITDFRKNLFEYARLVEEKGYVVEVEKENRRVFQVSRPEGNDRVVRAEKAAKLLAELGGKFESVDFDREFFRGKKEADYMKKLSKRVTW